MNKPEVTSHFTPSLHMTTCQPSTMKRGRKLITTAPTRTAIYQRNYRAQRAQHTSNLEERIHQLEAENAQLRIDLEAARANHAVPPQIDPQLLDSHLSPTPHLSECAKATCSIEVDCDDGNDAKG